ncbi:hypothetical protein GCM10008939_08080 [Deinococcus aquiradiocola]|uniref:DUF6438 domain-containing protein n=1 Tax=Deinococcus aquiradiocola TaxID=393059 RepID=A0A917P863_9DEIO|nr:hypothetical protein GCM10008939_08080 [Deinococcus aquiradiocola]
MTGVNRLPAALLLCLTTSVFAGGNDASPDAFELTLTRESCFGTCPMYTVHVNGNGAVDWNGERWVKVTGPLKASVGQGNLVRLRQAVQASNFFSLRDEYLAMSVSDLPYASVEVRQGARRKKIRYYLGDPGVPSALLNLAKTADRELGTATWIGR